jgi:hypothetical protein
MNRRAFITTFTAALTLSGGMAFSASTEDAIVAQLTKQGFTDITSETTWLGRLRILATRRDGSREIVINPRTGEILRDQFTALNSTDATQPILDEVGNGSSGSDTKGSEDGSSGKDGTGSADDGSDGTGTGSGGSGSGGSGSGGSGSGGSGSGGSGSDSTDDGKDGKGKDN